MPTVFSHAVAAAAIGTVGPGAAGRRVGPVFWAVTGVCAMLPDADVVAFGLGVPYGHVLGHRGLSHSLLAAVAVGLVCAWGFRRGGLGVPGWVLVLHFTLATASHGLLDGLTDGGRGVAYFAPFDDTRYFLPWRPIHVSPIGLGFLTARTPDGSLRALGVLSTELFWIWLPSLVVVLVVRVWRRVQSTSPFV